MAGKSKRSGAVGPGSGRGGPKGSIWVIGIVVVALVALVVARLIPRGAPASATSPIGKPVASSLMRSIVAAARKTPTNVANQAPVLPTKGKGVYGAGGTKPVLLYIGGEFCPYCAAERWALIVALERFGTLSHLHYMRSAVTDGDVITFTFRHSSYSSRYLTFTPVEVYGRSQGTVLQRPTAQQSSYLSANDTQGTIPFVAVGPLVWNGTQVSPALFKGLTWTTVAADLRHPAAGTAAGSIMQNANVLTAAICAADGQKPAGVCHAPAIASLEPYLSK